MFFGTTRLGFNYGSFIIYGLTRQTTCSERSNLMLWFSLDLSTKDIVAHGQEIQDQGARYCDCPACTLVESILKQLES